MARKSKRSNLIFWRIIYFILITIAIAGAIAPYISVSTLPLLQFIPIALIYLIPFLLLFYFVFRRKASWLSRMGILALALCAIIATKDFQLSIPSKDQPESFSVVSYNVRNFSYDHKEVEAIGALLQKLDADIVCLQEFRNHTFPDNVKAEKYLAETLGLQYYRFVTLPIHIHGTAIFSRFPIEAVDTLFMSKKETNSGILLTLNSPSGKIGIANLHMSSYRISGVMDKKMGWQSMIKYVPQQMTKVLQQQQQQVNQVKEKLEAYPHPLILAADLNSTPHTRISQQFNQYWKDSFRKKGTGIGWTYPIKKWMGMRIDYQFASKKLDILSHEVIHEKISDHYPIKATYRLKKSN